MTWHKEIWTYLIVTLVTVLIWAWAASETREHKTIPVARVQFVVDEPAKWIIDPPTVSVSLNIEGTKLSVQRISDLLRQPIRLTVPMKPGKVMLDLTEAARDSDAVKQSGATVVSCEPATIELELDQVDRITAPVKPTLPGVTPEGEITVEPREAVVSLPHSLRQRLPQDFAIEAFVDRQELDLLQPGMPQSVDAKLRLPEAIAAGSAAGNEVRINPTQAKVKFTIRSRVRETTVDSVRVQTAGPPEDREAYQVEVEPKVLRGVSVLADADLSRQIESGEVPVIAVVHLSSREKEAGIDHKEVSYFEALAPEIDGGTRFVQLSVKPGATMPVINLKITPRAQPAP